MNIFTDRRSFLAGVLASGASTALGEQVIPDFQYRYRELLERFQAKHPGVIREFRIVTLPGNAPPWTETGMTVAKGASLTILATGQVVLSRAANLSLMPRIVLWTRCGEADIVRPGSDTKTIEANGSGPFRIATLQGRWATPQGGNASPKAYEKIEGALEVVIIRWADQRGEKGMEKLLAFAPDDALIAGEHERSRAPMKLPREFEELWYVGAGANFNRTIIDNEPAISIRSELNGGIIRAPIDMPLTEPVTLEWDWRMNESPSMRGEDVVPFHQYTSVAVEFDDGQDLTWYWSSALEKEHHYVCPLPSWPGETHFVIRTGATDHGRWLSERRAVQADVNLALTKKPSRIVGVWLIALTAFGQRPASMDFRRIALVDADGKRRRIFPG